MKHIPHLVVGAPWPEDKVPVSIMQWRHLTKVLRRNRGDRITYTDGLGTFGEGSLGNQEIIRGEEALVDRPTALTLVVAPPANKDRQRFLVEKLTEMGVARLIWLETRHGKNRVPPASKVFSWVQTALEQSRGSWLMETSPGLTTIAELDGQWIACEPGGEDEPASGDALVIGPEGGFADSELPEGVRRWDLGPTVLRVETAAILAAARAPAN